MIDELIVETQFNDQELSKNLENNQQQTRETLRKLAPSKEKFIFALRESLSEIMLRTTSVFIEQSGSSD